MFFFSFYSCHVSAADDCDRDNPWLSSGYDIILCSELPQVVSNIACNHMVRQKILVQVSQIPIDGLSRYRPARYRGTLRTK